MEKLIELFKNHQGKNWTLFLIILGLVHSAWFYKNGFDIGTQNPYFIFLEILFIASSVTRILIAIDIFYIISHFCLADWLLKILWKKRRDEWRRWKVSLKDLSALGANIDITSYEFNLFLYQTIAIHPKSYWGDADFIIDIPYEQEYTEQLEEFVERFKQDGKFPYHIQYWIKLEIKKCKKAIAKSKQKIFP